MKGLTVKQQRVLEVIRTSLRQRGQPPTVREIGTEIGVASSCTVQRHLDALERKGFIKRDRYKYRSIELANSPFPAVTPRLLASTLKESTPITTLVPAN